MATLAEILRGLLFEPNIGKEQGSSDNYPDKWRSYKGNPYLTEREAWDWLAEKYYSPKFKVMPYGPGYKVYPPETYIEGEDGEGRWKTDRLSIQEIRDALKGVGIYPPPMKKYDSERYGDMYSLPAGYEDNRPELPPPPLGNEVWKLRSNLSSDLLSPLRLK